MYLLDTDTLTLIERDQARVVQRVRETNPREIATTVITKIELLQGRFDAVLKAAGSSELLRAQERLQRTEELLDELEIFLIDAAAAAVFDGLRQNRKLKKIGRADLLIASIALANQATLVTRNLKHFQQVPGLHVANWAD
jgi:tRNA(fMet)-specific endonuclease VapC